MEDRLARNIHWLTDKLWWVFCWALIPGPIAHAQGEVNMSNVGAIYAPISVNGRLAGPDFVAQLQTPDGQNIGEPAPFLVAGLFSGGTRKVEGKPPGTLATFRVAVLAKGSDEILGVSNEVTIPLGGGLLLPPQVLTGLEPFDTAGFSVLYDAFYWDRDFEGNWICILPDRVSAQEPFHPCLCQNAPLPELAPGEIAPPSCELGLTRGQLAFTLSGSQLTLRWMRFGYRLMASEDLKKENAILLDPPIKRNGIGEMKTSIEEGTRFYWLEPLSNDRD